MDAPATSAIARNNVRLGGAPRGRPMIFVHGFGCDQNVWHTVAPAFADDYATVLFDHVGAGRSDPSAFDPDRHASLQGYADDLVQIVRELDLRDAVVVGHSVGAMIAALATIAEPARLTELVLITPSPRYIDDDGYAGGFSASDIDSLLESLGRNWLGWSQAFAPVLIGTAGRPDLDQELTNSFCATDPEIARHFARTTFTSDNRAELPDVGARSLVLQCSDDPIAPEHVGRYVEASIPECDFVRLSATGHCPHLTAPAEVSAAIAAFLQHGRP
jgi:sigma-B regulation protein RsbQ